MASREHMMDILHKKGIDRKTSIFNIGINYLKSIGTIGSDKEIIDWYTKYNYIPCWLDPCSLFLFKWSSVDTLQIIRCDIYVDCLYASHASFCEEFAHDPRLSHVLSTFSEFDKHLIFYQVDYVSLNDKPDLIGGHEHDKCVQLLILNIITDDDQLTKWTEKVIYKWHLSKENFLLNLS